MQGVVLLSEIHPQSTSLFDPLRQAKDWFNLFTEAEFTEFSNEEPIAFAKAIGMIEQRCAARGDVLVLRDWGHLDYTGHPFVTPTYRPQLYTALADQYDILRLSTTRDPIAQWQSLVRLDVMQPPLRSGAFKLSDFLAGYRKYAELCVVTGFVRYEDFLRRPELQVRRICDHLQIKFDAGFIKKWAGYETITGDIGNLRHGGKINRKPMPTVDLALRRQFLANDDYHRICKLLGYDVIRK
jgi:hypothetical protein